MQGIYNQLIGDLEPFALETKSFVLGGQFSSLKNISERAGLDEGCTSLIVGHTTGKT